MDNALRYGLPCCSRCMFPLVAYICLKYVHSYHSLCRTISSYNPFSYVLLRHTSNRVTVPLVLHSLLSSKFPVVVLVPCMFLLFALFCLSCIFLESSTCTYVPSVASSLQTAVSAFSQIALQVVSPFPPSWVFPVCLFLPLHNPFVSCVSILLHPVTPLPVLHVAISVFSFCLLVISVLLLLVSF